jgi:hypothetical protein
MFSDVFDPVVLAEAGLVNIMSELLVHFIFGAM